jgi:predicted small secreted protein
MDSVTIVVAYLMKKHQMSLESALSIVRSKRPQVAPNEGFISQLKNFDKSLQGKTQIVAVVGLYVKLFQRKVVCISLLHEIFSYCLCCFLLLLLLNCLQS